MDAVTIRLQSSAQTKQSLRLSHSLAQGDLQSKQQYSARQQKCSLYCNSFIFSQDDKAAHSAAMKAELRLTRILDDKCSCQSG